MLKEQQRIYLIGCVCDPSFVWFLWAKLRLCARTDLQTFRCGRNNKGFIWFGRVCDPSLVWFLWAKRRLCARTDLQTFRRGRKTKDWFDWAVCVTELVWFLWAKFRFQFKNWPLDFQRKARIDFICVCVRERERERGIFCVWLLETISSFAKEEEEVFASAEEKNPCCLVRPFSQVCLILFPFEFCQLCLTFVILDSITFCKDFERAPYVERKFSAGSKTEELSRHDQSLSCSDKRGHLHCISL